MELSMAIRITILLVQALIIFGEPAVALGVSLAMELDEWLSFPESVRLMAGDLLVSQAIIDRTDQRFDAVERSLRAVKIRVILHSAWRQGKLPDPLYEVLLQRMEM
jgi:hypothetical protein